MLDLAHGLTVQMEGELTRLAGLLDLVTLVDGTPDKIVWRFNSSQEYTTKSAYQLQFLGSVQPEATALMWKGWAPAKCRFFLWTASLGRILTANLLIRRGWENNYFCALCERNLETAFHLLVECPWAKQSWEGLAGLANMPSLQPTGWAHVTSINEWMLTCCTKVGPAKRKGALSLVNLVSWELWGERNRRVFEDKRLKVRSFLLRVKEEIILWNLAGAGSPFDPG